jgi:hypothetical protein
MGRKTIKKTDKEAFRVALLQYAEMYAAHRQIERVLYDAQQKQRESYAGVREQMQKTLELWKKVSDSPHLGAYGYVLMPDGQMASMNDGSITFCKPFSI